MTMCNTGTNGRCVHIKIETVYLPTLGFILIRPFLSRTQVLKLQEKIIILTKRPLYFAYLKINLPSLEICKN